MGQRAPQEDTDRRVSRDVYGIRDPFGNQTRINQFDDSSAAEAQQIYEGTNA